MCYIDYPFKPFNPCEQPYTWPFNSPAPYQPIQSPQTGWVCPKCGRVNAPWVSGCNCRPSEVYKVSATDKIDC